MGFGTLFIGYFFLINISYFQYTDIIAGAVMLLALYRLSWVNRPFYTGCAFSVVFTLFSLLELLSSVVDIFIPGSVGIMLDYIAMPRYILIFALTVCILMGIREVAREVDARELSERARRSLPFTVIYPLMAVLELPALSALGRAVAIISIVVIIALLILIAINLVTIYRAYMQICMPDERVREERKSRFGFVNRFREYEEARSREYAEYKLNKKAERDKKKNKKK